jgi:regulator of protease activity HflC (stomatin/prohibitin superfamily)
MWLIVWTVIVGLVLLAAIVIGAIATVLSVREREPLWEAIGTAVGVGLIGLIMLVFSSATVVPTRDYGVVTKFGRPVGTLPNGLHWVAPWESVESMDGAIQIDWHRDTDNNKDTHGDAIQVRLGNQSNAYLDTSVRWEMKQDAADDLYLQYRSFDAVRTNLITRNLQTALNEVFAHYNPLATVVAADPNLPADKVQTDTLISLAAKATEIMKSKVGDQVTIFEIQIPTIAFDEETQHKIDQLNQQKAATAVAVEQQKTNVEQSKANNDLVASVKDPNVLVSKCLDIVRDKGGSPLGCWPGAGVVPTIPTK